MQAAYFIAQKDFKAMMAVLDKQLTSSTYLVGSQLSLADIVVAASFIKLYLTVGTSPMLNQHDEVVSSAPPSCCYVRFQVQVHLMQTSELKILPMSLKPVPYIIPLISQCGQVFDDDTVKSYPAAARYLATLYAQPAFVACVGSELQHPAKARQYSMTGENPWGSGPHPLEPLLRKLNTPWTGLPTC